MNITKQNVLSRIKSLAHPLLISTKSSRKRWLLGVIGFSLISVGAELWFYDNYRIAWDRQILKCINVSFLLVDLKDKELVKDKIYAYKSERAAPLIKDGQLVGKYLRGMPGDEVEVRNDYTIWINGEKVAFGMPHLQGMTDAEMQRFFGKRILKDDEYWVMGTNFISFDSRYWGPIHSNQIVGRAYKLGF